MTEIGSNQSNQTLRFLDMRPASDVIEYRETRAALTEARKLAIKALKYFRGAYRAALDLWRSGTRTVRFPQGTWWMSTFHGAAVADTG